VQIENLDHLGLVAGIVDELGLVELTDEVIEPGHRSAKGVVYKKVRSV
jgi:hypothetical protein